MNIAAISSPFEPEKISWRVGSTNKKSEERRTKEKNAPATKGLALAYIDARDVMQRLDDVVGIGNWQDRYECHGPRTICYLSIKIGDEWVTKADGAGDTAVEAEKGGMSDAFKRAAVKWGIGRYLYDVKSTWVALDEYGRIKATEYTRLRSILPVSIDQDIDIPKVIETAKTAIREHNLVSELRGWLTDVRKIWKEKGLARDDIKALVDLAAVRASEIEELNNHPVNSG